MRYEAPDMAKRSTSKDLEAAKALLRGRPIVLVGLMGAGKTIADIFAEHGEAYFRDGERKVIARLMENGEQILATGGGAYMNPETRARIKEGGICVWLKADLDLLMKRVMKRNDRPLLRTADPEGVMRRLIEDRYPVYAEADVTVECRDVQHAQMVNDVLRALARKAQSETAASQTESAS